ncbi:MAG: hypothetical protein KGJ86_16855, partial [Chloroflexota bacterium]|nr:hypothetical protein [Chloroflexota bacterium]
MAGAFDPLNSLAKEEHQEIDRAQRQLTWRVIAFRSVTVLAFLVLSIKLWDMQIVHSATYVDRAVENRVRVRTIKALRGVIYDRSGTQLAYNRPSFDIAVDTEDLSLKDEPAVLSRLAKLLKADPNQMKAKIDQQRNENSGVPVTIASSIDWETLLTIKEDHMSLPGVLPVQNTIRDYIQGSIFSGIEGYIGPISEEEYADLKKDGYEKDDKVGKAGIELTYENQLRGTN